MHPNGKSTAEVRLTFHVLSRNRARITLKHARVYRNFMTAFANRINIFHSVVNIYLMILMLLHDFYANADDFFFQPSEPE